MSKIDRRKKRKCSNCDKFFEADELTSISLPNGPCWDNICRHCNILVDEEIKDIFENNTDIAEYVIIDTVDLDPQTSLTDFLGGIKV